MSFSNFKPRTFVHFVIVTFLFCGFQAPGQAAMVTSEALLAGATIKADRAALREQLLRDDVRKDLLTMGVNPADVEARINSLTVSEISRIQGQLDSLPAGGDGLGTVALVLVILILLEVAGVIDIFPRI